MKTFKIFNTSAQPVLNLTLKKQTSNPQNEKLLETMARKQLIKQQINEQTPGKELTAFSGFLQSPTNVNDLYYSTQQHMRKVSVKISATLRKQEEVPSGSKGRSQSKSHRSPSNSQAGFLPPQLAGQIKPEGE